MGKYERLILPIIRKKVREYLVKTPGKSTLLLCVDSSLNLKLFDNLFVQSETSETADQVNKTVFMKCCVIAGND